MLLVVLQTMFFLLALIVVEVMPRFGKSHIVLQLNLVSHPLGQLVSFQLFELGCLVSS